MKECSKAIPRRLASADFINRYFVGDGVDVGGKPDPLLLYKELFCQMRSVRTWDLEDGDAQRMASVADNTFDFVHSSHCLEHLHDPAEGLRNWLRIVRPGGHVIFTVPDEDLYEQGVFPSTHNRDHKWTFTLFKTRSWSNRSLNLTELVTALGETAQPIKMELLTSTYRFELPRYDQTLTPIGECAIEVVIRKRTQEEIAAGTQFVRKAAQPTQELRRQFNQYRDDMQTLKRTNNDRPPFQNDDPI
ncbi:MAG: methyltransferase domain-containing protein [Hyphomicrobiaceae bacterium]